MPYAGFVQSNSQRVIARRARIESQNCGIFSVAGSSCLCACCSNIPFDIKILRGFEDEKMAWDFGTISDIRMRNCSLCRFVSFALYRRETATRRDEPSKKTSLCDRACLHLSAYQLSVLCRGIRSCISTSLRIQKELMTVDTFCHVPDYG